MGKEPYVGNLADGVTKSGLETQLENLVAIQQRASQSALVDIVRKTGEPNGFGIVAISKDGGPGPKRTNSPANNEIQIGDILYIGDSVITVTGIEGGKITLQRLDQSAPQTAGDRDQVPKTADLLEVAEFHRKFEKTLSDEALLRFEEAKVLLLKQEIEKQYTASGVKAYLAAVERSRFLVDEQRKNENVQPVLVDKPNDRLRITETYRGVVKQVSSDEVTVDYEVNDDIVEHLYLRSQFRDGRLPKEGDCLEVTVVVSEVDAKEESSSSAEVIESPRSRTNLREVPDDF